MVLMWASSTLARTAGGFRFLFYLGFWGNIFLAKFATIMLGLPFPNRTINLVFFFYLIPFFFKDSFAFFTFEFSHMACAPSSGDSGYWLILRAFIMDNRASLLTSPACIKLINGLLIALRTIYFLISELRLVIMD